MLELILELFCSNTCFFFQYNVKGYTRVVLLQHVFSRYNRSIYWSNFTTTRAFFKCNARSNTGALLFAKKWFLQHNVKPCSEVVLLQHVLLQYNALDYTNLTCHFNGMPVGVCMPCGHALICLGSYS